MAPSVGTEMLRIAGTPEALAPGKGVREGLWRITGTRAMRARRQAAEAALGGREGGRDVLPGDAQTRASGDQNPSRYCIYSQTSCSLSSRFVSRSFRNGTFFGRNLARTGASAPAKPEVAALPFGVISAVCGKSPHFPGLLAGALRVPSCHRRDTAPPASTRARGRSCKATRLAGQTPQSRSEARLPQ